MPVQQDDPDIVLARLEKLFRQGDWNGAADFIPDIGRGLVPRTAEGLKGRIQQLESTLIAARVARAHLGNSLGRVRAAARFANVWSGQ